MRRFLLAYRRAVPVKCVQPVLESLGAAQVKRKNSTSKRVANFYRGKVVRIVVGFPPGGGADVYSRLIARHLGRFIPGNPTLAVTNMPGAGSIIAGNYIFNSGARDGSEIGMLNGAVILEQLFAQSRRSFRHGQVPLSRRASQRNLCHDRHAPIGHQLNSAT